MSWHFNHLIGPQSPVVGSSASTTVSDEALLKKILASKEHFGGNHNETAKHHLGLAISADDNAIQTNRYNNSISERSNSADGIQHNNQLQLNQNQNQPDHRQLEATNQKADNCDFYLHSFFHSHSQRPEVGFKQQSERNKVTTSYQQQANLSLFGHLMPLDQQQQQPISSPFAPFNYHDHHQLLPNYSPIGQPNAFGLPNQIDIDPFGVLSKPTSVELAGQCQQNSAALTGSYLSHDTATNSSEITPAYNHHHHSSTANDRNNNTDDSSNQGDKLLPFADDLASRFSNNYSNKVANKTGASYSLGENSYAELSSQNVALGKQLAYFGQKQDAIFRGTIGSQRQQRGYSRYQHHQQLPVAGNRVFATFRDQQEIESEIKLPEDGTVASRSIFESVDLRRAENKGGEQSPTGNGIKSERLNSAVGAKRKNKLPVLSKSLDLNHESFNSNNRATLINSSQPDVQQQQIYVDMHGAAVINSDGSERYSRKVFAGGLPPDIDEDEINATFRRFGSLSVDWPHKAESKSYFPPKGYAFLLFHEEASVQALIGACFQEDNKLYLYVSSPSTTDKLVQIRPWRLIDADYVMDATLALDPRKTVFVGGVPRPLKAIELATIMNNLYGGVCYAGIDTDPELKYPKGAGRVAFSCHESYLSAISARFVQLQHVEFEKRVEVKPYVLDDQNCDECHGSRCQRKFAPFFCANINCLRYYCENCWPIIHSAPGKEFHKPLVKEGNERPRALPMRWS